MGGPAQRLISLTDLTSLNEPDDAAAVHALSLLASAVAPLQRRLENE